jgi:chromosome segregation ATPase
MNTIMKEQEEMIDLRRELSELTAQVEAIKDEKHRVVGYISIHQEQVKTLEAMMANPHSYPVGAGAGKPENWKKEIDALKEQIERLKEQAEDFEQPLEDAEEKRNQILFIIADKIGLDNLLKEREDIDKKMTEHNKLQKEHYELQKERYEDCKNTFGFKREDREFIAHHKDLNAFHQAEWEKLFSQREELTELIEALDPSDQDLYYPED